MASAEQGRVPEYDYIFFDSVGWAYTGSTPSRRGLGASEHQVILLAEQLAALGARVLVLNNSLARAEVAGVEYLPRLLAADGLRCECLIVCRYSLVPPIRRRRTVVWATDIPGNAHEHQQDLWSQRAVLVAVSRWHRAQFPAHWPVRVIPNMLPDSVYQTSPLPRVLRFVYASAALKGLRATVAMWARLRAQAGAELELVICSPGYDRVDLHLSRDFGVSLAGNLPFDQLVEKLVASRGLFYVNTFPETFCVVAALCQAVGRTPWILCMGPRAGLAETVQPELLSQDSEEFQSQFLQRLKLPSAPLPPQNFRVSRVLPLWLSLLSGAGA